MPESGLVPELQPTGSPSTVLIIIRGPSGSGKSTISRAVRLVYGRQCALVEQDHLRRIVLRELDVAGGLAPALIEQTARFALDHGLNVVVEGILHATRYRSMLTGLLAAHRGRSHVFYLDVPFAETIARHATRPQAGEFTPEQMREWYVHQDFLGVPGEIVVPAHSTARDTIDLIHTTAGFAPAHVVRDRV